MAVMAMCVLLSCTEKKEEATLSGLMKSNFVSEVQGKPTALYVLKNLCDKLGRAPGIGYGS